MPGSGVNFAACAPSRTARVTAAFSITFSATLILIAVFAPSTAPSSNAFAAPSPACSAMNAARSFEPAVPTFAAAAPQRSCSASSSSINARSPVGKSPGVFGPAGLSPVLPATLSLVASGCGAGASAAPGCFAGPADAGTA
ncbi:hypothetical protein [Burkholderia sp. F1]|uniref:hypothetical protein n=1 Tax=Burkholderia sp. F1 TaxID=3366817 RepID=UPI003D73B87E